MQFHLGDALVWCGRPEESLACVDRALKLSPNDNGVFLTIRGMAQWMQGEAGHARTSFESAIRRNPSYPWAHGMLAVVHCEAGDRAAARHEAHAGRRFNRRFSLQFAERVMPFLLPEHRERFVEAWRAADMPDEEAPRRALATNAADQRNNRRRGGYHGETVP
jgi:tetratricopeptide (TPR) repeat protein